MKRNMIFILMIILIFVIAACGKKNASKEEKIKISIDTPAPEEKKQDDTKVKDMEKEMQKLKTELEDMKNAAQTPADNAVKEEVTEPIPAAEKSTEKEEPKPKNESEDQLDGRETVSNMEDVIIVNHKTLPVQLDGRLHRREWKDATILEDDIEMKNLLGQVKKRLHIKTALKYDFRFLYIAVLVEGDDLSNTLGTGYDGFIIRFDNNSNGVMDSGEDFKTLIFSEDTVKYRDNHFLRNYEKRQGKKENDRIQNGQGKAVFYSENGKNIHSAEFMIDLRSGDKFDISVKPGDTIRANLFYVDRFPQPKYMSIGGIPSSDMNISTQWAKLELKR